MYKRDVPMTYEKFDQARRELLEKMTRACEEQGLKVVSKVILFDNDEVPRYLAALRERQERARHSKIVFGDYVPACVA